MKKLCVVFGGKSVEHDISIITGMQCAKKIEEKYNVEKIYLGIDNKFYLATNIKDISEFQDKEKLKLKEVVFVTGAVYQKCIFMRKLFDVECVVNCCHGGVGENGDLAGYFSTNYIKCTSAGALSSHIAMDKSLTKELVSKFVSTIKGIKVTKLNFETTTNLIEKTFSNELIVKPNSLGSSIGVKACSHKDFKDQVMAIFEMEDDALVEERVQDLVEYNQACFLDEDEFVLSSIEQPLTKNNFLTFEDKYETCNKTKGKDRDIPAKISKSFEKKISTLTKKIYKELGLSGVVRIDYIFDNKNKKLYFNEVNTIPGSLAFYLYEAVGLDYLTLIEKLVKNAKNTSKFAYFDTKILKNKKI